ncbi:MAG: translocation/assembly module TamB domain-containing protein, partial [bacterium]
KVDNPGYKWFQMDSITGQGFIDGATGEFKVGKFRGNQNTSSFEINGTIHPSLLKNGTTLNLSLSAENYDLAAIFEQLRLPVFCDETSLNMDIKIKGTTDNPLLYGKAEARFTNPRIENLSLSDTTSFSLEFDNNRLDINGIIKNGDASLLAKGNFDVKQFIPNQARTSQTSSDAPPVISFTNLDKPFHFKNIGLDVDVKLSGKNNSDNLQLVLLKNKAKLTGTIEIVNGSYKVSPLPISKGSTKSPVEIDLMVIVPAGFPVSSGNTMNITLEKSTLDLSGSPGQPVASGEINVLDGHLRLLDRTFTVNEAKLQFKEFLGIDNPYLKGEASTIIVSRSIRNFQGTENLVVTAKINAQLRQLNKGLTFTSNKGTLTENEVMGIVMRQDLLQDFNDEGLLSTLSQQAFTIPGAFISRFFESKGGFQLFQIGVDFENDVFVNLEYETFPNFFLDYYQAFASDPEYDIYMKYKFRNDSFIGVGTSDEGGVIIRLDYIIQLK